jgi:hypothetical protein
VGGIASEFPISATILAAFAIAIPVATIVAIASAILIATVFAFVLAIPPATMTTILTAILAAISTAFAVATSLPFAFPLAVPFALPFTVPFGIAIPVLFALAFWIRFAARNSEFRCRTPIGAIGEVCGFPGPSFGHPSGRRWAVGEGRTSALTYRLSPKRPPRGVVEQLRIWRDLQTYRLGGIPFPGWPPRLS